VERVIAQTWETTSRDAILWSTCSMAKQAATSQIAVSRIWRSPD
jgi:hypothetical protein